ncbi:OmpH family outer membrane protein [Flavobacterium columnare]|uniref:OmpH family outer membrane protein n=3 Tax=Flavobacterium TaxID=237 RepID=A0A2N9PB89_9FLAO|nr:OmpH family outer membrane protein [Flavobacterium columnare]RVU90876.1 OmpH family outer membrane protein [Flavobacterium columnare]SPE77619.1 periplasmic chaperone [Flavobacterium columnare]
MRFSWEKCNNKILPLGLILFIFIVLLLIVFQVFKSPDVVCVDNAKLFEGFNMTKEMKKAGEHEFRTQKAVLDSLYAKINTPGNENNQNLNKEFILKRNEFEQASQAFVMQESAKIWKRLQEYVQEYAVQKNYQIVIGSTEQQQIIYANSKADITLDLIQFSNQKYEGN